MKEFLIPIANSLADENGPLYVSLLTIIVVTLGWRFLGKDYTAELGGVKIYPANQPPVEAAPDRAGDEVSPKENESATSAE